MSRILTPAKKLSAVLLVTRKQYRLSNTSGSHGNVLRRARIGGLRVLSDL